MRRGRELTAVAAVALLGSLGSACTRPSSAVPLPEVPASEAEGEIRPFLPPISLTEDMTQDAIVRVVGRTSCTGTLIADDLVLTAHHCVSKRDESGRVLAEDEEPGSLMVELGGDDLPWGEVGVRAIVAPKCGYRSGHGDLAILVLERKLIGMPAMEPRIDRAPEVGDELHPVGFGRCALSYNAIRRKDRGAATIAKVRKHTFVTEASICPGDSGGPALDAAAGDAEILGVVSSSVMDGDEQTMGRTSFVRLDLWPDLFSAAREIADGASPAELPPYGACE